MDYEICKICEDWGCAVKKNHLECLKKLYTKEYIVYPSEKDIFARAVSNGNLEIIKFLLQQNIKHDEKACAEAATYGYLECLKYLHENGCEWDVYTSKWSALNGHLNCLQYAYENGCPWDGSVYIAAAENGHLECS